MINNRVLEYIKQQRQQGVSDKDIKAVLTVQGWQPQDLLDEALYLASNQTTTNTASVPIAPPSNPVSPVQPVSTTPPPVSSNKIKPKAPLLVIIIAWLMLIGGLFSLLGVLPFLLLGGFAKVGVLFLIGVLNLVRGVGLIVVSFGIRHMRKWALYAFTVLTVIAVLVSIYSFATSPKKEATDFVDVGIQALVAIYFWAISKKFV